MMSYSVLVFCLPHIFIIWQEFILVLITYKIYTPLTMEFKMFTFSESLYETWQVTVTMIPVWMGEMLEDPSILTIYTILPILLYLFYLVKNFVILFNLLCTDHHCITVCIHKNVITNITRTYKCTHSSTQSHLHVHIYTVECSY